MRSSDKQNCSILLDILAEHGLEDVIISPGSRNTPLIIAADGHPLLRCRVVIDERMAAFMALGMSMVTRRPTALICTSGTALYNYAPAVAEAFYQHVPMIVISADRPEEWIDQDDSQTLIQPGALSLITKKTYDIPDLPVGHDNKGYRHLIARYTNDAYLTAIRGNMGPVHINVRLDNPLSGMVEISDITPRIVEEIKPFPLNYDADTVDLIKELAEHKILITAGFMAPDAPLQKYMQKVAAMDNVAVFAEPLSNLHLPEEDYNVDCVLSTLTAETLREMRPDYIISMGGSLVSRKLKEYLRGCDDAKHISLGDSDTNCDCFRKLSLHIDMSPCEFMRVLSIKGKAGSDAGRNEYRRRWNNLRRESRNKKSAYLENIAWSELQAFSLLLPSIPGRTNLVLSNGTPIRYLHLLADSIPHAVYCNRGVSGIEGGNATALGISLAYRGNVLLITGDTSFSYMPNILGLKECGRNLKIIVINNSGGGIFRFIPSTRNLDIREKYFCPDPRLPLRELCEAYNWDYTRVGNADDLTAGLKSFFDNESHSVMEIVTDAQESAATLIEYFNAK